MSDNPNARDGFPVPQAQADKAARRAAGAAAKFADPNYVWSSRGGWVRVGELSKAAK